MNRLAYLAVAAAAALPVHAAITGTVVDAAGVPVANARVEAFRPPQPYYAMTMVTNFIAPKPLATATTDAKGVFTLDVPGQGVADVHTTADGYAPADVFTAYDDITSVTLRKAAVVSASVTANGKPVAGATVFVVPQEGMPTVVKTDARGAYQIPDPKVWAQFIAVAHPDFTPATHPAANASFTLESGREVKGKVIDEKGAPVANADVTIEGLIGAKTADDGTFIMKHVPQQSLAISAKTPNGSATMRLPSGSPTLRLRKTVHVTGVVRDASKQPLANIGVVVADEESYDFGYTDARGAYSLNAPRGKFAVNPTAFGVYDIDNAQVDGTSAEVRRDFEAKRARFITGVVKMADGSAVAGAAMGLRIELDPSGQYQVQPPVVFSDVRTGADGRFRIAPNGAEKFRVVALKRGLPPAESPLMTEAAADRAVTITIPDGVKVSGKVFDPDHHPISGVAIEPMLGMGGGADHAMAAEAEADQSRDSWAITADDGSFTGLMTRGSIALSFSKKGFIPAQQMVDVAPGMPAVAVSLARGATLRGKVVKKDGTPASEAMVLADDHYAMTDADGAFVLEDLEPGDHEVQFGRQTGMQRKTVHVPADDVRLVLPATRQITGRVTDAATGVPIEQFAVFVYSDNDSGPVPVASAAGEFSIEGPENATKLMVSAAGYAPAKDIPLTDPAKTPLVIALTRGRTIRGRVVDAAGQPIAAVDISSQDENFFPREQSPQTSDDGSFEVSGIGFDDDVTLAFSKEGFVPEQRKLKQSREDARLDVTMRRGIAVAGHVLDPDGNGVANVSVSASSATHGAEYTSADTDSAGAFQFAGLAPARYEFSAQSNEGLKGELKDVDVEKQHDVTIRLEKHATALITGHVSGLDPSSVVRMVTATNELQDSATASIDAAGNFRLQAPTGVVEVQARMGTRRGSRESRPVSVDAPPNSERRIELVFAEQVTLRGTVLRGATPAAGINLRFNGNNAGDASATASQDGTYQTLIDPGDYDVTASDNEHTIPFQQHISVASDAQIDFRIDTNSIRVTVLDAGTEQPVAGASLNLMHRSGTHSVGNAQTGADGSATVEIPRSEPLVITASRRGYANAAVDVAAGSSSPVVLRLPPSAGAIVRLVDRRDGRTLSGYVIARDDAGRVLASSYEEDPDGTVTLPVPSGRFKFSGSADGYGSQTVIGETGSGEVTIALPRGGAIALRSNTPIQGTARLVQPNGEEYVRCWCNGIAAIEINGRMTLVDRISPGTYTLEVTVGSAKPRAIPITVVEGQTLPVPID